MGSGSNHTTPAAFPPGRVGPSRNVPPVIPTEGPIAEDPNRVEEEESGEVNRREEEVTRDREEERASAGSAEEDEDEGEVRSAASEEEVRI